MSPHQHNSENCWKLRFPFLQCETYYLLYCHILNGLWLFLQHMISNIGTTIPLGLPSCHPFTSLCCQNCHISVCCGQIYSLCLSHLCLCLCIMLIQLISSSYPFVFLWDVCLQARNDMYFPEAICASNKVLILAFISPYILLPFATIC